MAKDDDISYQQYKDIKQQLLGGIKGTVLEIGPGTGVNFPFLSHDIKWIGAEPNEEMHPYLTERAEQIGLDIEIINDSAEHINLPDSSVDNVISTIVLCSVDSVTDTLGEILRVLKPGGKFLFIEHQADQFWTIRRSIQEIVPYTPWRYFSNGCFPARKIKKQIEQAGFKSVTCTEYMQEGGGLILAVNRPHIYGEAIK